jgi:hypothetical protein
MKNLTKLRNRLHFILEGTDDLIRRVNLDDLRGTPTFGEGDEKRFDKFMNHFVHQGGDRNATEAMRRFYQEEGQIDPEFMFFTVQKHAQKNGDSPADARKQLAKVFNIADPRPYGAPEEE